MNNSVSCSDICEKHLDIALMTGKYPSELGIGSIEHESDVNKYLGGPKVPFSNSNKESTPPRGDKFSYQLFPQKNGFYEANDRRSKRHVP